MNHNHGTPVLDAVFQPALDTFDDAFEVWLSSLHSNSITRSLEAARRAHKGFSTALAELDKADSMTKATERWQYWYEEVTKCSHATYQLVAELEAKTSS